MLASIWGPEQGSKNTMQTRDTHPPMPMTKQKQCPCGCWVAGKAGPRSPCRWLSVPVSSSPGAQFLLSTQHSPHMAPSASAVCAQREGQPTFSPSPRPGVLRKLWPGSAALLFSGVTDLCPPLDFSSALANVLPDQLPLPRQQPERNLDAEAVQPIPLGDWCSKYQGLSRNRGS